MRDFWITDNVRHLMLASDYIREVLNLIEILYEDVRVFGSFFQNGQIKSGRVSMHTTIFSIQKNPIGPKIFPYSNFLDVDIKIMSVFFVFQEIYSSHRSLVGYLFQTSNF
jgi:hypothetical protein